MFNRFFVVLILVLTFNMLVAPKAKAIPPCTLIHNVTGYTPTSNTEELTQFNWIVFSEGKVIKADVGSPPEKWRKCHNRDGKQHYMLPGLIDAHGHVFGLGKEMLQVNLRGSESEQAAVNKVKAFAHDNPSSTWILGRGWNQVLWLDKTFPHKNSLDKANIGRPVLLTRVDGHAAWANSKALQLAGITAKTPDPDGGKILRDTQGNATGVLIDNAISLVRAKVPNTSELERTYAFDKAFDHLLSLGITSVHDAGVSQADLNFYLQRNKTEGLPVRIYGMLAGSSANLSRWLKEGIIQDKSDKLSIRSVKLYSDGALGSRGAALLAPYSDDSDNKGLLVTQPEQIEQLVEAILKHGFQANVHAIGDRGNHIVLDAFEKAYKKVGGKDLRNRIEHSQVVALEDIPRFKALNLIASMQPVHATSDKNMAGDRLGKERLKGAYAWQKFLQQGTIVASGSDFPVELANPFHGLYAAITRQDRKNQPEGGWLPEEKMTPTQALRSFTLDAAYAAHQENKIGSLEKGKWADFILIDKDILGKNQQDFWQAKVYQTWIAGRLVYENKAQK